MYVLSRFPKLYACFVKVVKTVCMFFHYAKSGSIFCPVCKTCMYVLSRLPNLNVCCVQVAKPVCMFFSMCPNLYVCFCPG